MSAPSRAPRLLLGRFTTTSPPLSLFRLQSGPRVQLRLEAAAHAAGRASFDISARDGAVHARDAAEAHFLGPNGMLMRPIGPVFAVLLAGFRGKCLVHEVPPCTPLPPELVLLHEHSDLYSVQPARSMTPAALNAALTAWLAQPAVLRMDSKEAFYARYPDMRPEIVGFSENA